MNKLPSSCKFILQFLKYNEILSAQELHERMRLSSSKAPSLSTTYRSLEILLKEKQVQSVEFRDGEKRFELVKTGEHHHHLICEKCGVIVHLEECSIIQWKNRITEEHGFILKQHVMEMFGLCNICTAGTGQ